MSLPNIETPPGTDDSPRYEHDCEHCTYLGRYKGYDLYHCNHNKPATVIARFGKRGADYISGIGLADQRPELKEAIMRAVQSELTMIPTMTRSWIKQRPTQPSSPERRQREWAESLAQTIIYCDYLPRKDEYEIALRNIADQIEARLPHAAGFSSTSTG